MLGQVEDSPAMLQDRAQSDPNAQPPLRTLDYEPPPPRRIREPTIWLAIVAALFASVGIGSIVFGLMQSPYNRRDDVAIAVGFGAGSLSFGLALGGLYWLRRRRAD